MSNKAKTQDKSNKITEIDDHIRRHFDIQKVILSLLSFILLYSIVHFTLILDKLKKITILSSAQMKKNYPFQAKLIRVHATF